MADATTLNLLELARREGLIVSAETLWGRIVEVAPTVNPAPILTSISPSKP